MKTLALGRLPRATGQGIRFQCGTVGSMPCSAPGSLPVKLTTVRHATFRNIKAGQAGSYFVVHIGSNQANYVFYQIWAYGTTGHAYPGTATGLIPVSFLVWGE